MLKSVLFLLAVVTVASAIVCRGNICDTVRCRQIESCPEGQRIKEKGGFCACCDSCVQILGKGDRCGPPLKGVPPTSECDTGLTCDPETFTCV